MDFSWFTGLFRGKSKRRPERARSTRAKFRPEMQALEDRLVPATTIYRSVSGAAYNNTTDPTGFDNNFRIPADPSIAVGVNRMVEIVNSSVFVLDKSGATISQTNLFTIFGPVLGPNDTNLADQAVYDDNSGRFYIFFLSQTSNTLFFAVSNDSTPNNFLVPNNDFVNRGSFSMAGFTSQTGGGLLQPIDLRVGYNREAVFVTADMITAAGAYDSTILLTINKVNPIVNLLSNVAGVFPVNTFQLDNLNYGMAPAAMHNASAGGPAYFVSTFGIGNNNTPFGSGILRVTTMTNTLSPNATFRAVSIAVDRFGNGPLPDAAQPGDPIINTNRLHIGDTAITNAAWRDNHLVAAQTAKVNNKGTVRWYEIDTSNRTPALLQQGNIDPGAGISTFFPRIEISGRLDIGITYDESSANEFLSTYVTGRAASDPKNFMQTPVLAKAGQATYIDAAYVAQGSPFLPGTYSGIAVDPASQNNFWAIGQWATAATAILPPAPRNNWATQITSFSMSALAASQVRSLGPLRFSVSFNPATGLYTYSGNAAFINNVAVVSGTFILVFNLPDPSVTMISPGGALNTATNQYLVSINGTFPAGQVLRFPIVFTTPKKLASPTFFASGFTDII
jgi:hypothetical protein